MAPPTLRSTKPDTGRMRPRNDTKFKASDGKDAKRKPIEPLPPGLREEDDDNDWPPKYKKAPAPAKVRRVPARHPRTGRKLSDPTSSAPRPKTELRTSPERAFDLYDEGWRNTTEGDPEVYERRMRMFYEQLKKDREYERSKMIREGLLSDPNKPTTLENAITIVGICQDMCPVRERVERIVQQMVDKCEKVVHPATGEDVPYEDYMVKRFRRSAAGDDEQLPSDIRPPSVLQKTLNYLLEEVVNGPEALCKVHKFVWDRTRAIRNDFSIQQVTKPDDVRIAIDCFERIARFHILALHQLSLPENVENNEFDAHQELEQLNKTLLSLTYYYDDNRETVISPNEAEFRAYMIMIEIEYSRPNLEQRAGTWRKPVLEDLHVQMALSLYASCGGIEDDQGPWFAGTEFEVARSNPQSFFVFLKSSKVPYLLACAAEISFHYIRGVILESVWTQYKDAVAKSLELRDLSADEVRVLLGFDDQEQVSKFCLDQGLLMKTNERGKTILGLKGGHFKRDRRRDRAQVFSRTIVEGKRVFRTYLEITNGLSAPQEGIEEAIEDLYTAASESISPLTSAGEESDNGKMNKPPGKGASKAKDQVSDATTTTALLPNSSSVLTKSNTLPNTSTFGKPSPPARLSTEDKSGPSSLTKHSALQREQSPISQSSINSATSSKSQVNFSAPGSNWTFPKSLGDGLLTKPAFSTSSTPKDANSSPQVKTEKKISQPSPFSKTGFFDSPRPNPFSQSQSDTTKVQPSPFAKPDFFTPPRSNPFSQSQPEKTNFQPSPFTTPQLPAPSPPNPFSQSQSAKTNFQPSPLATPQLPTPTPPPSNPFSQSLSEKANVQPSPFANADPFKHSRPNPFSQFQSENTNADRSQFTDSNLFKPASPISFPQVSPPSANAQPASNLNLLGVLSAPLSNSQSTSTTPTSAPTNPLLPAVSPFSGSFNNRNFFNPAGIASLPTLEMLRRSTIPVMPIESYPPSIASSPFSGSFNGVQFSKPSPTGPVTTQNAAAVPLSDVPPTPLTASSAPAPFKFSTALAGQSGAAAIPSPTSSSLLNPLPRFSFLSSPKSSAVLPQGGPASKISADLSPTALSRSPFPAIGISPISSPDSFGKPPLPPVASSSEDWNSSTKPSFQASGSLFPISDSTKPSPVQLNASLNSSDQIEKQPTMAQTISPASSNQTGTQSSVLQNAPPLSSEPDTATSAPQNVRSIFDQPAKSSSIISGAIFSANKPETTSVPAQNERSLFSQAQANAQSFPGQLEISASAGSAIFSISKPMSPPATSPNSPPLFVPQDGPLSILSESGAILKKPEGSTSTTMKAPPIHTSTVTPKSPLIKVPISITLTPPTPSTSISFPEGNIARNISRAETPLTSQPPMPPSASPAKTTPFPAVPDIQKSQIAETDSHPSDQRSKALSSISKGIMLDQGCLTQQFLEFHVPNIVEDCIQQVEDERSRKEAKEYRVMKLSKKYIKIWRATAWKRGLRRRAPERRRRFAEFLRETARDAARDAAQQKDLSASLSSQNSDNRDQEQGKQPSTELIPASSTSTKKRKSLDVVDSVTPDRVARNKRSRVEGSFKEHVPSSRRVKTGHRHSATAETRKLTETVELVNKLIETRSDYSYLASGSASSYRMRQKICTLLPPIKLDDTRSDYFRLKSLGLDPDTPVVPRASRKRHSDGEIETVPSKRLKESPSIESASAVSPSYGHQSPSPPPLKKAYRASRDQSAAVQALDLDETESELLSVQHTLNRKMTDPIEYYREQRAKFGSGKSSDSGDAPSRSIEYYKEQRAKWGTPAASSSTSLRHSMSSRPNGELGASGRAGRDGLRSIAFEPSTKTRIRAAVEQRQRDLYTTWKPEHEGPVHNEGVIKGLLTTAATAAEGPAGSSPEDAIEL